MKNKFKLTKEEQEIEEAIARGEYTSVSNFEEEKAKLMEAARFTLSKTRTISVRITERNLMRLKAAAAREGLPYQTLISSLIQKNV